MNYCKIYDGQLSRYSDGDASATAIGGPSS